MRLTCAPKVRTVWYTHGVGDNTLLEGGCFHSYNHALAYTNQEAHKTHPTITPCSQYGQAQLSTVMLHDLSMVQILFNQGKSACC